jgi:hypothetical protein
MTKHEKHTADFEFTQEPMALREVRAVRLQIAEETKGMTPHEFNEYVHKGSQEFFRQSGIKPCLA